MVLFVNYVYFDVKFFFTLRNTSSDKFSTSFQIFFFRASKVCCLFVPTHDLTKPSRKKSLAVKFSDLSSWCNSGKCLIAKKRGSPKREIMTQLFNDLEKYSDPRFVNVYFASVYFTMSKSWWHKTPFAKVTTSSDRLITFEPHVI